MTCPPYVRTQVILAPYTTLGVGGLADFFVEIHTLDELREAVTWAKSELLPITILGSGSNVLVYEAGVRGVVLHMATSGIAYHEEGEHVYVTAEAGVLLDALVGEVVEKGLWGLENLSHIPGTVGAVPVQNVGAYGVEGKDVIEQVTVYDTKEDIVRMFTNEACMFAYRDSIFKHSEGAHLVILSVTFRLTRVSTPHLTYRDLVVHFGDGREPTLKEIREAIVAIRTNKLPDWHTVGTAGSFFKNPIISREEYEALSARYPEIPGYPEEDGRVKVPLGWILDKVCGLSGYHEGKVGLYEKQALVLVCERGATAHEVESFVKKVCARVYEATGIVIEQEVRVLQ